MNGAVGAHRFSDREQVVGEPVEPIAAQPPRMPRRAGAAHVVADDVVVGGQVGGHHVPDAVGVRVAVHEQHGRRGRIAEFEDGEVDAAGGDGPPTGRMPGRLAAGDVVGMHSRPSRYRARGRDRAACSFTPVTQQ